MALREPSVPKTLADSLSRVNKVYTTGPTTRLPQRSLLWDEPTILDKSAETKLYEKPNIQPACMHVDIESIAFVAADAPSSNSTLF